MDSVAVCKCSSVLTKLIFDFFFLAESVQSRLGQNVVTTLSRRDWEEQVSDLSLLILSTLFLFFPSLPLTSFSLFLLSSLLPSSPPSSLLSLSFSSLSSSPPHSSLLSDLSTIGKVHLEILNVFGSQSEDVRSAASYALGQLNFSTSQWTTQLHCVTSTLVMA